MADYSNRNTYLKMMLGDSSVSNTNVPNIKDYIGNIGLNDEDIADALIMNNQRTSQELVNSISATSNNQNNASTTSAPTTSLPKIEEKGWWENLVDGASALWAGFWDGLFNFADDVGDFFISTADWMMGGNNSWADDAINYDWQAQATNSLNFLNPLLKFGDIAQNYNEWGQSITQGGDTARQYLNEQKQGSWADNGIGNFLIDAVNSIGYMLPSIAVGIVGGPAAGLAVMGIGAGMGQTSDAYQESNNMATALLSGIVAGGIEAGTEALGGFIPGAKTIGKTTLKAIGRQMLEEGAEEAVSGIFQPLVDSIAKWSADPFFSEDGTFVYLTPEFWVTGEDSVARQAALGAFTGGIFAAGNIATNRIKYGKTGQNFGKAYQEFVETRNEAVDLERKHKSLDAISEKLGQASVNLAEQTKALKTAIENGDVSKRQLKNIAKDIFGNKTLAKSENLNTEVANVLNDSLKVFNGTPNVKTEILSSVIADINRSTGSSFKMDVQDNLIDESGNKVNAYFNPNTNTILFDTNAIDNQGYQLLGHEVFGHGILESFNTNPKFKDIIYKEIQNDNDFVNKYKNKILQEYQTTENSDLYKSELISYYIQENVIENNDINKLELLANNRGFIRELFNNLKLILNNTTSSRVIREVRKAVRNFTKNNYRLSSILLKIANNKPLSRKEQEYYNQNKDIIDAYLSIFNETNSNLQVAYSKELSSEEKESLAEKSFNNINNLTENDIKKINKRYADVLLDYESFKKFINNAIFNNKNTNEYGIFGTVDKNLAEKIKQSTNLDYENVFLALDKSDTKHTYNRHILNKANGIKMEINDIYLLPYFLEKIEKVKLEDNGNLKFNIRLNDLYDVILRMYGNGKNNKFKLCLKSLYIIEKGANPSVSDTTNAPLYTSETSSESLTPLSNTNISQNENNVNNDDKNKIKYSRNLTDSENDLLDKEFDNSIQDLSKEDTDQFKKIRNEAKRFVDILETTKPTFDNINEQEVEYIVNTAPLKSSSFTNTNDLEHVRKNVNNIFSNNLNYFAELLKIKVIENNDTQGYWLSDTTGKNMREISNQMIIKGKPSLVSVYGSLLADLAYQPQDSVYIDNYISDNDFNNSSFKDIGIEFTFELKDKTIDEIAKILEDNNIQYATITNDKKVIIKEYGAFASSKTELISNVDSMLNKLSNVFKDVIINKRGIKHYDINRRNRQNLYQIWNKGRMGQQYGRQILSLIRSYQETTNTRKQGQEGLIKRPIEVDGEVIDKYNVVQRNNNTKNEIDINVLETNKANKVKENANRQLWQKVLNLKDAKKSYNSLINHINDKLNIDLDVSNKQDKIRALFDSYNVNEINNTLSDFAKDLLNSKVYKGVDTSLRELFESNGLDSSILENDIRKALKGVLDSKSKTSDTTKLFNKLQASLLKASDLIETYKNRARQFASLYKKVENIKKKLKIENNNTKLSDIKLDEVNLLKYLVSGRVFTNQGGISGTWRTRFYNLMQEDNSYFSALRNSVFNEYGELDKAIETFEYLGNSYDARRTTQLTLNLEEADALIQAFNSVLNAIKEYQNNYYSKVEELSRNVYNEQIGIIEANRNQSSIINKFNTAISRVSSPLSNLALYFGGENTRAYKSLIENIENKYGDYLYDVSDLQNSLQEKLEAISKKGILANQSKSVKSFRGINKLNKWHLYSMWLNLNAPSNLARVSEKGFTFKDKVGQTHHIYYDENLLSDIETYLDGVEIEQLQTLLDFYNVEVKEYIKKAQVKIDGFSNVLSNTYYPQITSKSELKGNLTGDEPLFLRDNGQFKNLKARTGVVTSLDLVNPLSLFREYIDSASRYSNLTQAERLLNRTLNKNVEIDGEKTSIRKLFKERYGNEFEKHLTSFFNKLTGNNNLISNSVISKIGGKSATAMLWFNFSTVMKQLGSLPMTANITGFSNVLRSLKNAFYVGKLHKQLYENNGYYRNRIEENGIIYANTMNSNVLQQASNIRRKIVSSGLKAMSLMDQYVVLLSFKASQENVYRLHNKDANYKPGTELNIKEASLMMNKILLQTQSNAYAISTSMLRSGEMGDLLRYTFGVFGSDNQNKISELYQQAGTAIKQRNYLKYLQDKLNNSNITPEEKANIEKEIENSKSMYKTAVKRLLVRSIPNLAVSAVITTLVGVMMKYLLGRDKDEEWENFTLDFVGDAFVDWMPFIGTIYNAFQYDDGNFTPVPFAQIINLCEVIFNSFNKLSSGNLTQKEMTSMAFAIFNALSMLGGISPKNISNLIIGIADKFNPTTALKMQSLLYGYSQSYYTRLMKNALERKDYKNYKTYYKTNAELFKVNELSDKVLDKIISLKKLNYDVTMRNVPTSYNDENGVSHELTSKQISDFKEIYSLANKAAESVLNQTRFVKLTSEEQATVLRKIFDAYYDYAKAEVLGLDLVSRASKIIDMTDGQINIAKYIAYAQDLSDITGSDRRQQIEKKLNVYYLSEFEKEMVLYLSGYEI